MATPWRRARRHERASPPLASFGGAIEFIFSPQASNVTGGKKVGGFDQMVELAMTQLEVTVLALALALLVGAAARPLARPSRHRRAPSRSGSATPAARSPSWR